MAWDGEKSSGNVLCQSHEEVFLLSLYYPWIHVWDMSTTQNMSTWMWNYGCFKKYLPSTNDVSMPLFMHAKGYYYVVGNIMCGERYSGFV